MSSDLLYFSAGVFANYGFIEHSCRYMLDSCELYDIPIQWYGVGSPEYPGWIDIKIKLPIAYLESRDEEYVLYTDGQDAFFTGSKEEIWAAYESYGKPDMLTAATKYMFPHEADVSIYDEMLGAYRYPHVGGYIGRRKQIIKILKEMLVHVENLGDDANVWYHGYKEGWFKPTIDNLCLIFQLTDHEDLDIVDDRLFNVMTNSYPCILHVSGGYSDQRDGKIEAVKPWYNMVHGGE